MIFAENGQILIKNENYVLDPLKWPFSKNGGVKNTPFLIYKGFSLKFEVQKHPPDSKWP
jgi:hypothetical protein